MFIQNKSLLLFGLQNYWTFDNHSDDTIGFSNLYDGRNVSFVSDKFGNANSAVYFNLGYYSAPPGVYFRGDHTVAVWVKVIAVSAWSRIIDFGNGSGIDNIVLSTSYDTNGKPVSYVYSSSVSRNAQSDSALQLNQWNHLAHTYSAGTCNLYLNGTLTASAACLAPRAVNRTSCYVGKSNWPNAYLNAHLDELRIYSRGLNVSEINQLMAHVPTRYTSSSSAHATSYSSQFTDTNATVNDSSSTTTSTSTTASSLTSDTNTSTSTTQTSSSAYATRECHT